MEYDKSAGAGRKFVEGIALSFEIMALSVMLQIFIMIAVMAAAGTVYAANAAGGYDAYGAMIFMNDTLSEGDFMVMLTVVATAVSAGFSVSIYWIVWGRKKTETDRRYLKETVLRAKPVAMVCIACVGLYYLAILISAAVAVLSPDTLEEYNEMMESALGGNQMLAMLDSGSIVRHFSWKLGAGTLCDSCRGGAWLCGHKKPVGDTVHRNAFVLQSSFFSCGISAGVLSDRIFCGYGCRCECRGGVAYGQEIRYGGKSFGNKLRVSGL